MSEQLDCVVIGSCVVDLICRPVDLNAPVGGGVLVQTDPLIITGGGISNNAGITMARLGMRVGVLSYVGEDGWASVIRDVLAKEGVDDSALLVREGEATSTTVVLVDLSGERSFLHTVGAPKKLDAESIGNQMDLFARSKMALFGYYSLMPLIEPKLDDIFKRIRETGCKTAMDAAGNGGTMKPLDRLLPHLDVYVPSQSEAQHQTGLTEPQAIIETYRNCGAPGLLGVKLGLDGVLLSPSDGEFIEIPIATPPGEVVDTTGAGDSFYAGLLTGLVKGLSVTDAGHLGAAAAACCVTSLGGSGGGRDYGETSRLAGIDG